MQLELTRRGNSTRFPYMKITEKAKEIAVNNDFTKIDIVEALKTAMHNAGIAPPDNILVDAAKIQRFHIDGDKKSTLNGWYKLHTDFPPSGAFGCYKRGISQKFSLSEDRYRLPQHHNRQEQNTAIKSLANLEQEKQAAITIWEQASPATNGCRYLLTKKVKSHGLRYYKSENTLLVPVVGIDEQIQGVQKIFPDGTKRFALGTYMCGHFFLIGKPDIIILIAEGYATAATLYEVTGHAAIVAFDAGNLLPVAIVIRERYPSTCIILCADNDQWTDGNPGLTFATKAAQTINALLAVPIFRDTATKPTDFNDLSCLDGSDAVCQQVSTAAEVEHV